MRCLTKIALVVLLMMPYTVMAQSKVAVYVIDSPVEDGIKKIIGSEMVSAIVANRKYQAVERTPVFLEQLSKEQNEKDDNQISLIGRQIGVDNVCVVDITSFQSSYYVQARLLDVNEAVVLATARVISTLSSIDDIISTTEQLTSKLISENSLEKQVGKEYSIIGNVPEKSSRLHLISVDNTGANTVLTFKWCTAERSQYLIKRTAYVYSKFEDKKYLLINSEGIDQKATYLDEGIHTFKLFFEKIPDTITIIDFVEPKGWSLYDIKLKPYGKDNYHEFVDNSETNYKSLLQQKEIERQNTSKRESSYANALETLFTYELKVLNKRVFPRMIWVGEKFIGTVKGRSEATFKVATTFYGAARSVQAEGYVLYPTTESFYIQKPYSGQMVIWVIK